MAKKNLIMIKITDYWGEGGRYEEHTLGEYLVVEKEDFHKQIKGLRKVCQSYEDWDEVEEFVYKNFEVVEYHTSTIEIE